MPPVNTSFFPSLHMYALTNNTNGLAAGKASRYSLTTSPALTPLVLYSEISILIPPRNRNHQSYTIALVNVVLTLYRFDLDDRNSSMEDLVDLPFSTYSFTVKLCDQTVEEFLRSSSIHSATVDYNVDIATEDTLDLS